MFPNKLYKFLVVLGVVLLAACSSGSGDNDGGNTAPVTVSTNPSGGSFTLTRAAIINTVFTGTDDLADYWLCTFTDSSRNPFSASISIWSSTNTGIVLRINDYNPDRFQIVNDRFTWSLSNNVISYRSANESFTVFNFRRWTPTNPVEGFLDGYFGDLSNGQFALCGKYIDIDNIRILTTTLEDQANQMNLILTGR